MSKKHLSRVSVFSCVIAALALGSCLNPVSFDVNSLPRIPVEVTGSVSISDVAVLWLINRTKTVDVLELTVSRAKGDNETVEDYKYPKKIKNRPGPGSSLASYHVPTEAQFTLTVVCRNSKDDTTGVLGPYTVQFPRAQDYRYYLYWTTTGELVLIDEARIEELPQDPDTEVNYPPTPVSNVELQTLVVLNVTLDQDLNTMEFKNENAAAGDSVIYLLEDRPLAEDQARVLLGAGSYATKAAYTDRNGSPREISKTTIVTKEDGSMAAKTNYLFFYKVKGGGYDLSPVWPPLSNDAAGENSVIDALTDTQGILQITNKAKGSEPVDNIQKIRIKDKINDKEYPAAGSSAPYMVSGDVNQYIVEEGTVSVFFKPMDPLPYGGVISRTIRAKQITTLNYTGALADNQDQEPPAGQGLIRITNKSTAPVVKVMVSNRTAPDKFQTVNYEKFIPSGGIESGATGRVLAGGNDFPLNSSFQLIKVQLTTAKGSVEVERLAFLSGKIVDITITEDSLRGGGQISDGGIQLGAKITVKNNTTAAVVGIRIYNKDSPDSFWLFPLDIPPGETESLQIPRTDDYPIEEGAQYAAGLVIAGYGGSEGSIEKQFEEGGDLYGVIPNSPLKTVILNQDDLLPGMVFKAVKSIGTSTPFSLVSQTKNNDAGVEVFKNGGGAVVNLSNGIGLQFTPADASKKSPIKWTVKSAHTDYVSINGDGVLTVKGVAPKGNRNVTLQAVIEGAGENEGPFTGTVALELIYDLTTSIDIYIPF
jgi:hypothetical protein